MSGQIVIENNRLVVEQGTAASTVIVVENGTLDDVEIAAVEGVAHDLNRETGELVLSSNVLGTHEILVGFKDEEPQDIIILDVTEEAGEQTNPPADPPVEEPKAPEAPVVPPAPIAEPTPPVQEAPPAPAVEAAPAPAEYPREVAELMRALDEYKSKMGLRNLIPTEQGIAQQQKLFKAIIKVLNKEDNDFRANMNALVKFVKENRQDVFNERAINRFIPQVKMNKEEILLFTRLTALLMLTADISDRKLVASRIDFKYIEQRLKNAKAFQRLMNYYNPATE